MKRRSTTFPRALRALLLMTVLAPVLACDTFEPTWLALEDFAVLFSLSRAEYIGRESAYDFVAQTPIVVERPKNQNPFDFDMAVTEIDGAMHVLPAGVFEGFTIQPGIQRVHGTTFDQLDTAPRDDYITDAPIPLVEGGLYAVRTRRDPRGCNMYGKFEVLAVTPAGVVEIRTLRNPLCNDRNMIPPDR